MARWIPDPDETPLDREDLNRVHEELEKLNISTDVINKLELQLDEARATFRESQSSWSQRLEQLNKKLGSCIEKSRPYYEARLEARRIHEMSHQACIRFERANSLHQIAKQQVALTQESLNRQNGKGVDPACLEVLNHHIQRVNEAEDERVASEEAHRRVSVAVAEINQTVTKLEKELSRSIKKSRAYFDARVEFTRVLEQQKLMIGRLELEIKQKKVDYNQSLRNLERISERIHEERQVASSSETQETLRDSSPEVEENVKASVDNASSNLRVDDSNGQIPEDPPSQLSPAARALLRRISSDHSQSPPEQHSPGSRKLSEENRAIVEILSARPQKPLDSGVILLPNDLNSFFTPTQTEAEAFRLPAPEHLDVSYRTVPEGVKQVPTPAGSLSTPPSTPRSDTSDNVSLASTAPISDDDRIACMLRSHTMLIKEIDEVAERAKTLTLSPVDVDDVHLKVPEHANAAKTSSVSSEEGGIKI